MFRTIYEMEEVQRFCKECESYGIHTHLVVEATGVDNETLYVIEQTWQCQNCGHQEPFSED